MNFKVGQYIVIPHRKAVEKIEFIERVEGVLMLYTTARHSYASHQVKDVLDYVENDLGLNLEQNES